MRRSTRRVVSGAALLSLSIVLGIVAQHPTADGATTSRHVAVGRLTGVSPNCSYAPSPQGYLQATAQGDVLASGRARLYGTLMDRTINEPVVGLAGTPTANGYLEVASDGGVFAFGDAGFHGSMGGSHLNQPIVGIAGTADGGGYWMVASDGGVFAFGDAGFHGSMGGSHLNQPIVGIAGTADRGGYWMVASDGGVFAFGDAGFHGSMGGSHLNQPIVGIAGTADGGGYWMVAADGGIFAFGDAGFHGSMGGTPLAGTITGMASTPSGAGYWLSGADGGIFAFGDASYQGSFAGGFLPSRTVGIVSIPANTGISPSVLTQSTDTSIFQYGADYYYASAGQTVTAPGASVEMCATDAGLTSVDAHTLTELAVAFDPSGQNYIEIGWVDSSPDMGDLLPHLFANWWKNGVSQDCSYFRVQVCGFVEVPALAQPIMYVPTGVTASYAVEHVGRQWNCYFDGQLFGYFPDSLWNGASTTMQSLQAFGEVAAHPGTTPSIIMGNGLFARQAGANRVTGYQLLGSSGTPAAFQFAFDSVGASYDILATQTSFSYGGSGGSRGMSGPQITVGGPRLSGGGPWLGLSGKAAPP
jgi:hypothetical protein